MKLFSKEITNLEIPIFHFSDTSSYSWFELAMDFVKMVKDIGLFIKSPDINYIKKTDYPLPASRTHFSLLEYDDLIDYLNYLEIIGG